MGSKEKFKRREAREREFPYPVMSVEDCIEIQQPFFDSVDDKYNIFMWTIDKHLFEVEQKMKDKGYKLHARIIWDKENGVPAAYTVRFAHEYLLWFYEPGHILLPRKEVQGKYTDVIREKSTRHSVKPEAAYAMLEDMFPDVNKIELFARKRREGWDAWGNEV